VISDAEVEKFKKAGFRLGPRKSRNRVLVTKKIPAWGQFEEEILILFRNGLQLSDVNGGPVFRIAGFQLDVAGGIEDTLLVVECKSKNEPGRKPLRSYIRSFWIKKRSITNSLRKYLGGRYKRTVFILALRGISPSRRDLDFAKKKNVLIWPESYVDSIRGLYFTIGDRAKHYVLRELGGTPPAVPGGKGRFFSFPAIEARIGKRDHLYSTFIPARILLDVAYVLRIESGQRKAYQRYLDKNRLLKIAKFIDDGNSFKNSIVLALDKRSKFKAYRPRWISRTSSDGVIGVLRIPRQYAYAWVIDGQHRLYGFARAQEKALDWSLPVVALQSKSQTDEARTFLDINSKQKPVDSSLLWVLFGVLDPNEIKGLVSLFVRYLATEPRSIFYGKIFIPGESKRARKHYRIFHSNLCDTVNDHFTEGRRQGFGLLRATDAKANSRETSYKRALTTINTYMKWLVRQIANSGEKKWAQDFFFTNNGLNVGLRVLVQILKHFDGRLKYANLEKAFGASMTDYLKDNRERIDELRRQTSSEGTREATAFKIVRALAEKSKGFADTYIRHHQQDLEEEEPYRLIRSTERILREVISERLSQITERWWQERIPNDVREAAAFRKATDESPWPWMEGKQNPVHYYMSFSDYSKVISKRDNWREAFEVVFRDPEWVRVTFKELEHIRNDVAHNRDLSERQLQLLRIRLGDLSRAAAGAPPRMAPTSVIPIVEGAAI